MAAVAVTGQRRAAASRHAIARAAAEAGSGSVLSLASLPPLPTGAIGLIAAPAIGASQEGVKGFCKGAAAGVAGAVLLPVTGVVVGAVQVRALSAGWGLGPGGA